MSAMRTGVLLCLLLAGTAFGTHPAAAPVPADSGKTKEDSSAFHVASQPDLARLGLPASYAATTFSDSWVTGSAVRAAFGLDTTPRWPGGWYQSSPQQFLTQVFPGAKFFRVEDGVPTTAVFAIVFRDGRSYPLDGIADVLAAQGFSFTASELSVMAKVAVLSAYCGRRVEERPDAPQARRLPHTQRSSDNRAFPAIEFRSFTIGTTKSGNGVDLPGVWVGCLIDSVPRSVFVGFSRVAEGNCQPDMLWGPDCHYEFMQRDVTLFPQSGGGE
jgi:hypothetical protein